MTPNVKKIILSISVWPVHLWTGIIQGNTSMNVSENNSGIHPLCLFLLPRSHRCWSWGAGKGGSGGSKRQGGTARGQQALLFLWSAGAKIRFDHARSRTPPVLGEFLDDFHPPWKDGFSGAREEPWGTVWEAVSWLSRSFFSSDSSCLLLAEI